MTGTAIAVSLVVTGLIMAGWIAWGVREYRRTGHGTWLWMAVLLGMSFLALLSQLGRLSR